MRIAVVTDAWEPQVNGVVRTLQSVRDVLEAAGHEMLVVSPGLFRTVPCPTYPEIRLALATPAKVGAMLAAFEPDAIHLATEGPLCIAARHWCRRRKLAFTTAYHTQFPEYVAERTGISPDLLWRYIRWFHRPAQAILASTATLRRTLAARGLTQVRPWGRGVDLSSFHERVAPDLALGHLPRPLQLYVGRVAPEKNIEAFLAGTHPGTKIVVGDGPAREGLERRHPSAIFMGPRFGAALAAIYAAADVFVFPSRTDTFGLVMVEALACGTPVAAYPVPGPLDVLKDGVGAMDDDLDAAIGRALACSRAECAAYARRFTWEASAAQFLNALVPASRDAVHERRAAGTSWRKTARLA